MEARYQKLVASSLQGWKLFVSLLAAEHQEMLQQQYTDILNNAKFWKLGKHQAPMVICSPKGLFTVSVSVSVCIIANKWVPLISIVVFTLSDAKHQREKSLTLKRYAYCE